MIQLKADQVKAIAESAGPLEFVDPKTNERFSLIRADFYEHIRNLLEYDEPTDAEKAVTG